MPVVFIENKLDYTRKLFKAEPIAASFDINYYGSDFPIAEASFPDERTETTIVSYGGLVRPLLQTIYDLYMEEEIPVRLLDISSLSPMNFDLLESLLKDCENVLVVEEGHIPFGIGDAIISQMVQRGLKTNYKAIGASQHIIGSSKESEAEVLPQMDDIRRFILIGNKCKNGQEGCIV